MGRGGAPLAARELPALFSRVHEALGERRAAIDDLNVFPVPDGDTGTNMTLTVRAGLEALHEARPAAEEELALAVIRGAVGGARGNSGVILSQVLRAVVEVVTGHPLVDARLYAQALAHARDLAYEAVAEPVEGTILTVIAAAAEAAEEAVARGEDLVGTSATACAATAAAVEMTREQLAVLRDAEVVDAGARGFEVLLAAVHGHLTGTSPQVRRDAPRQLTAPDAGVCHASSTQPYEVQYLLHAPDEVAGPLRRRLEGLGDSVVVVAAGGLLNVHVHTSLIGPTIEAGVELGRPSSIEVTHLREQIAARRAARESDAGSAPRVDTLGVVAVLDGAGLERIAAAQGAMVVPGSAGALPSVSELLAAITASAAVRVAVLPGHRNAIPTARKAAELAEADGVRVVEVLDDATTPPAVLAALAVLDLTAPPAQVVADLRAAASGVRTGEVVLAVREADTPLGHVTRGQPLAIVEGNVVHIGQDECEALQAAAAALDVADAELVTLLFGASIGASEQAAARAAVAALTSAELETLVGDGRSRYWIGVE